MKNKIGSILIVIVLTLAVVATTYSWFTWKNNQDKRVGISITASGPNAECIVYSTSHSGSNILIPVSTRDKGYITNINVSQNCNVNLYADFKLKVKNLPPELKDETFKYALVYNNDNIGIGDFKDARQEETLDIANNEEITSELKNYKFYLWIDGQTENSSQMENQNYEFELSINVTDSE